MTIRVIDRILKSKNLNLIKKILKSLLQIEFTNFSYQIIDDLFKVINNTKNTKNANYSNNANSSNNNHYPFSLMNNLIKLFLIYVKALYLAIYLKLNIY